MLRRRSKQAVGLLVTLYDGCEAAVAEGHTCVQSNTSEVLHAVQYITSNTYVIKVRSYTGPSVTAVFSYNFLVNDYETSSKVNIHFDHFRA